MLHGKLNRLNQEGLIGLLVVAEHFQNHDFCIGCDTGLCTRKASATKRSSDMSAMSVSVGGVVVMIGKIVAVVGELSATIPELTLQVGMGEAYASVDDGNENALAGISELPNPIGVHL